VKLRKKWKRRCIKMKQVIVKTKDEEIELIHKFTNKNHIESEVLHYKLCGELKKDIIKILFEEIGNSIINSEINLEDIESIIFRKV